MQVAGDGGCARLDGLCGLIAGRGAQIEEGQTWAEFQHWDNGLGADVLYSAGARDVGLGGLQKLSRDRLRGLGTELPIPLVDQPLGQREFGGAAGPRDGLAVHFPQYGIYQPGSRCLAGALHQFDAFGNRGVRRNPVEIPELIDAHPQRDPDLVIQLAGRKQSDQMIELGLMAQAAENDLRSESGVPCLEVRRAIHQKIRRVATLNYSVEHFKRNLARGRDQP